MLHGVVCRINVVMAAASCGHAEAIVALVGLGADLNYTTKDG